MKKLLLLNGINYGSTGKIMNNIAAKARQDGYEVFTACRNSRMGQKFKYENQILIGSWLERVISERLAYQTGLNGHFNILNTYLFINKLKKIKPDIIHIHNLCDNFLNIKILFKYLSKQDCKIVWTFHDSWPITGRCGISPCDRWKYECSNCPNLETYPNVKVDRSNQLYKEKKISFNSLKNMMIVTPSKWLKDLVQESYLKDHYPCRVINNGIDLDIYKKSESDFRKKNNLEDKYIVLAVSYGWSIEKGVDTLIRLGNDLPDKYKLVVVGTNDETDKILPDNVLSIHKTYNQQELVDIYSTADLFINPSIYENYPTVNMEALACGCPVLTHDVGGAAEMLDERCGMAVKLKDYDAFKQGIIDICEKNLFKSEDCIKKAYHFDMHKKFDEYIKLYDELLG